ncbi:MAG: hypothetical protein GWP19_00200 [Planctomycetia bacterium]|nr:hypothetical protein [Planctomycetia bacterium]
MLLIDQRATLTAPSSLFLTRAEIKGLYPHLLTGRKSYIFKYDKPLNIPDGEGRLLLKKYPHVLKWEEKFAINKSNRHQELNKLTYGEVKRAAGKIGFSFKEMHAPKLILIEKIVSKEIKLAAIEAKAKRGLEENK